MKFVKYLSLFVAAAAALVSCETGIEEAQINPAEEFVAPVLDPLSDIVVNADNLKAESVLFTCSAADFGLPVQITYQLYLQCGETTILAAENNLPVITLDKQTFNGLAMNQLGIPAGQSGQMSAYVIAIAGQSQFKTEASNVISFNVTTYRAPLSVYYMCGYFVNAWDINNAVLVWEKAAGTRQYEALVNMVADPGNGLAGFKVMPGRAWSGDWGYDAFSSLSSNFTKAPDGNLVLPEGAAHIKFNITNKTIEAVSYPNGVDIAGSWDASWGKPIKMNYDYLTNTWRSAEKVPAGSEYKIRMNCDWAVSYGVSTGGGTTGKAAQPLGDLDTITEAYEVDGSDNIKIPGTGDVTVVLHAERVPWVVSYE